MLALPGIQRVGPRHGPSYADSATRYICERYGYPTTVGNLKAKIMDTTAASLPRGTTSAAMTAETMHLFFRGRNLANEDTLDNIWHSLTDDNSEVIVHAMCAQDVWGRRGISLSMVREASKQLWSMGPGRAGSAWLVG